MTQIPEGMPTALPPKKSPKQPTRSPRVKLTAQFPQRLGYLFEPARYKVAYGGRGGAKSWGFARALLLMGVKKPLRILCARETQRSIAESVHKLLSDQVRDMGLDSHYTVQKATIEGKNGTAFIFAGIRQNVSNLKSYEACDICWVEEAQNVSKASWNVLIPTIRKDHSEIWATFNPELESDDTYQRFVVSPPSDAKVVKINWQDNPWFPEVLRREMEDLRAKDFADYQHVYEGACKQVVEGAIYRSELAQAEADGRIRNVPYDATRPVDTFWDLGWGDNTSIWFAQSFPFEFRIIDHLSGSLQPLSYYLAALQERRYAYGTHWLPHDGAAHELGSGKSIQEQIQTFYGQSRVRVAKRLDVADGIAAVRAIFGKCYFDRDKCSDGLQSLKRYRYERDQKTLTFKREPLHDSSSHDADAFRTLGVAIADFKPNPKPSNMPYTIEVELGGEPSLSWMG